jgi:predicted RNase H-like nuclease (RuvC/YqgF family)
MQEGFELLEERIRKAADLVHKLRRENKSLEDDLARARTRIQEAEKRLDGVEKQLAGAVGRGGDGDALGAQVKKLTEEREQVKKRISKLVDVLENLEG